MKALLLTAAMVAITVAHEHKHKSLKSVEKTQLEQQIEIGNRVLFEAGGANGFITGWYRGMYKMTNFTINTQCFGNDMLNNMQYIDDVSLQSS